MGKAIYKARHLKFQSTRPRGARLFSTYIYTAYSVQTPDPRTPPRKSQNRITYPSLFFQISVG